MPNAFKISANGITAMPDPTTGSGDIFLLPEFMGQSGRPFAFMVEDPPHKTRERHYHHGDVIYVYTKGEHHIEGEGTYRAGDIRWTKAGHIYGPETTGPEGGAWWVISYNDPIPVDSPATGEPTAKASPPVAPAGKLATYSRPYDWDAIEEAVLSDGGVILGGFYDTTEVAKLNGQIDQYLTDNPKVGSPKSGSPTYDVFLGHRTVRLHGLVEKIPVSAELIGNEELVSAVEKIIGERAASVLLNAGELIQIGPEEPAQYLHRDTDSWPDVALERRPILVNAILALDDFTLENGATYIAAGSWQWDRHRQPTSTELMRAEMSAGDAVLFRGDLLHGGGENSSSCTRRGISVSYCAGWLRPVENSFLNVPVETASRQPPLVQRLLGYAAHDAIAKRGGILGLFENGDPARKLETA